MVGNRAKTLSQPRGAGGPERQRQEELINQRAEATLGPRIHGRPSKEAALKKVAEASLPSGAR